MTPDRETVRFILENWSVPYSMLPRERNQDRARVVDVACAALKVRATPTPLGSSHWVPDPDNEGYFIPEQPTKPHPPQGETEIL